MLYVWLYDYIRTDCWYRRNFQRITTIFAALNTFQLSHVATRGSWITYLACDEEKNRNGNDRNFSFILLRTTKKEFRLSICKNEMKIVDAKDLIIPLTAPSLTTFRMALIRSNENMNIQFSTFEKKKCPK